LIYFITYTISNRSVSNCDRIKCPATLALSSDFYADRVMLAV